MSEIFVEFALSFVCKYDRADIWVESCIVSATHLRQVFMGESDRFSHKFNGSE